MALTDKVSKRAFNNMNLLESILTYWNYLKTIKITDVNNGAEKLPNAFDVFSHDLIKKLKLTIIETLGKTLNRNDKLKRVYLYSYNKSGNDSSIGDMSVTSKFTSADWFIQECISWLQTSSVPCREYQSKVLKFIQLITENDPNMQSIIVPHSADRIESSLINSLKNLMKKNAPESMRHTALKTLWTLSGEKNECQEYHDRKCAIYKLINPEELIDLLFSSENEIVLICLEAVLSILTAPPYRDSQTKEIVNIQEQVFE